MGVSERYAGRVPSRSEEILANLSVGPVAEGGVVICVDDRVRPEEAETSGLLRASCEPVILACRQIEYGDRVSLGRRRLRNRHVEVCAMLQACEAPFACDNL